MKKDLFCKVFCSLFSSLILTSWFALSIGCGGGSDKPSSVSADVTPPTVVSVTPANGAVEVAITTPILVNFSEPISPNSVNTSSVKLMKGSLSVPCSVSVSGTTLTVVPSSALEYLTKYTCLVTALVKDLAGNSLQQEYSASFTTMAEPFIPFSLGDQYFLEAIVTDEVGNVYVAGQFNLEQGFDIFVARFDANGRNRWLTKIHTYENNWPYGGLVASRGFVYLQHESVISSTGNDIYVSKLAADTGQKMWTTKIYADSFFASSLAVDDNGVVYATNNKETTKLDSNGMVLLRAKTGGGGSRGPATTYAFNGLFFAGQVVGIASKYERFLTKLDANLSPSSIAEWRRDARNVEVVNLAISKNDSIVCVAEYSWYFVSPDYIYTPFITAYKYNNFGGGESLTNAWTRTFSSGLAMVTDGSDNSIYAAVGPPETLYKMNAKDGKDIWSVPLLTWTYAMAEYGGLFMYRVDGTSKLWVYDAQTGKEVLKF